MSPLFGWLACFTLGLTPAPDKRPDPASPSPVAPVAPVAPAPAQPNVSEAEKVARLQKTIESGKTELESLEEQLKDPDSEYKKALQMFQSLDEKLQKAREKLKGKKATDPDRVMLEMEIKSLEKAWMQAKEGLALSLAAQKTLQQKIQALREKLQQDQKVLDQLTGKEPPPAPTPMMPEDKTETKEPPAPMGSPAKENKPETKPGTVTPALPTTVVKPTTTEPEKKVEKESEEVKKARAEARSKEIEAQQAKKKVESIDERLKTLNKNISLEKQLLSTEQKKVEHIQKVLKSLEEERQKKQAKGEKAEDIQQQIEAEQDKLEKARENVQVNSETLKTLEKELDSLQAEQQSAQREEVQKKQEVETAKEKVESLQNPFTPRNLIQWALNRAPKVLGILICMVLLHYIVRMASRRAVKVVARRSSKSKREQLRETEQRADTLVGVVRNFSALAIWGGGTLMILEALGIPIVPLMGGAAVLGLAVAFGAQNLIRDYFTGFMILVEDQYAVRDFVQIGDVKGIVERISLRMTVLRDVDGGVHFIPHGTVKTVTNLTHTWSRAYFELGIAYKEDVDHVMEVIKQLGAELRQEETFAQHIQGDLEMLGLDSFGDSAVMIKFWIRTKPLKQWMVKREMLRRIKKRFDLLGIEIPFPQGTVYHRTETATVPDHALRASVITTAAA